MSGWDDPGNVDRFAMHHLDELRREEDIRQGSLPWDTLWPIQICTQKSRALCGEPQSARKAALPQNCLTADKIVLLFGEFVNTSRVINQLINAAR